VSLCIEFSKTARRLITRQSGNAW